MRCDGDSQTRTAARSGRRRRISEVGVGTEAVFPRRYSARRPLRPSTRRDAALLSERSETPVMTDAAGPPTETLARAARGGSEEAFSALYARVAPSLFAWATLRSRPELRRHVSAEDIVQEVWVRAFASFDQFDPSLGSFRTWVFTIATRHVLNLMRGLSRRPREEHVPSELSLPDEATRISQQVARDEALRQFIELARGLDPEDREILMVMGLEGLSAPAAGKLLRVGGEAAKKRWQRLRSRLRDRLPDTHFFE